MVHPTDLCSPCTFYTTVTSHLQSITSRLGVWVLGTTPICALCAHHVHDSPKVTQQKTLSTAKLPNPCWTAQSTNKLSMAVGCNCIWLPTKKLKMIASMKVQQVTNMKTRFMFRMHQRTKPQLKPYENGSRKLQNVLQCYK